MNVNKNRYNKGTKFGEGLIKHSLKKLGCCRSIVCDKDDNILCGNDVYRVAQQLGIRIVTIETEGDVLICIKRKDIYPNSTKAKEIALVDNLAQEKNLDWDTDVILRSVQEDLSFNPKDFGGHECLVKELDLRELLRDDVVLKDKKEKKEEQFTASTQLSLFE